MRGDGSIAPAWSQLESCCSCFPSYSGCFADLDRLSCSIARLAFCSGSCSGHRSSSSTAAPQRAGAAPPHSRRRLCQHSGRPQRRHPHRHRPMVQSIHSTVPSTQRTPGPMLRKSGVAACTTVVVSCSRPCCHRSRRSCVLQPILTIVLPALPTGRLVGVLARSTGAAKCTAKAAMARAPDV